MAGRGQTLFLFTIVALLTLASFSSPRQTIQNRHPDCHYLYILLIYFLPCVLYSVATYQISDIVIVIIIDYFCQFRPSCLIIGTKIARCLANEL